MNKCIKIISIILITISISSCEEPMVYKYQDKPQLVACEGLDKALIHEALYSFQEDISNFYKSEQIEKGSNEYYIYGYSNFVQPGLSGIAPYKNIMSPHTTEIMKRLKKEKNLWVPDGTDSHLNYKHPFVTCLLGAIQKEDLRIKFESLRKVGYIKPKVLAVPMRGEVNAIVGDPNLAMYVALDGFYQNLYHIDSNKGLENE